MSGAAQQGSFLSGMRRLKNPEGDKTTVYYPWLLLRQNSEKSTIFGPGPGLISPYNADSVIEPIQKAKLAFFHKSFLGLGQSSVLG